MESNQEPSSFQTFFYRLFIWGNISAIFLWAFFKLRTFIHYHLCTKVMYYHHVTLRKRKGVLFDALKHIVDANMKKTSGDSKQQIRIAEIGSGAGHNLEFFPEGAWVTAVEPFDKMQESWKAKIENSSNNLHLEQYLQCFGENMADLKSNSFDAVVCTFTLCSVKDVDQVFNEVHRILKPGGVFLFIEHVLSESSLVRGIQYIWSPFHFLLGYGCVIIRQPHFTLSRDKFKIQDIEEFDLRVKNPIKNFLFAVIRRHAHVIAVKM